jgi:hypothetical protein
MMISSDNQEKEDEKLTFLDWNIMSWTDSAYVPLFFTRMEHPLWIN